MKNGQPFTFPYDREKLLERIRENRDRHVEQYEEAWKGYLIEVHEQLEKVVKDARAEAKRWDGFEGEPGKMPENPRLHFNVAAQPPQSHEDEYNRVIDMLEFTTQQEIMLTPEDFNQYVRDEWQWSRMFNETASSYSAKFRSVNS